MSFDRSNYNIVRASDVGGRDGIGVEISRGGELVCEIFRDDSAKTRVVWLSEQSIGLEELEGFIRVFKDDIDWGFMGNDTASEWIKEGEQDGNGDAEEAV